MDKGVTFTTQRNMYGKSNASKENGQSKLLVKPTECSHHKEIS